MPTGKAACPHSARISREEPHLKQLIPVIALATNFMVGGTALAATPDDQDVGSRRLEFFTRAQVTCKLIVLGNPDKGAAFVTLLASSDKRFEEVCECAAVYAVSQTSDETIKRLMAGEKGEIFDKFWKDLHKALPVCLPTKDR